jgi:hypothetical protein
MTNPNYLDDKLKKLREEYFIRPNLLLQNIKQEMPNLEKLLETVEGHWNEEDLVYRFYHQSFKVYRIQNVTKSIYGALENLSPHEENKIRDRSYLKLIAEGASGRVWKLEDNQNWNAVCRPMLEAFFHSKYFLRMAIKYGKEYDSTPARMKSGWAALLELYGIR